MPMRYFIPDWDDRVDPSYNFLTDAHSPERNPYRDDVYAHEIFDQPPYDGILLSLATLEENKAKRDAILASGGVHRYLRLPADSEHEVLGDCGAFSYWDKPEPTFQTEEVLEDYQSLGFDLGVSVDHLIFAELEAEKERRWQITMHNAETFLRLHKSGGYHFTPIGVAQGWDPASYQRAARALLQMGYEYIAIGGLVRSPGEEINRTLQAIYEVLKPGIRVHLFGVSRPEQARTFASLGVTSFDSASRLRRAWMDGRRNYFLGDDAFTAIRIPEASALAKKRGLDEAEARRRERAALDAIRAFDRGEVHIDEAHRIIAEYSEQAGDHQRRVMSDYRRTLERRPWRECPCTICRTIGVEVIIFRGNNRNRRRGFHNTWQLYQLLRAIDPSTIERQAIASQLQLEL